MSGERVTFLPMAAGFSALLGHHRALLDYAARTGAMLEAVARLVRPGDVVADLGTGTGILAIAARRAGARRVFAVDIGAVVGLAAQLARDNGVEGVTWIRARAAEAHLPEPVDLLISECFGPLAFGGGMVDEVLRCRRWLAPGGRLCPSSIELWAAPISSDALHRAAPTFGDALGLDWSAARALIAHQPLNARIAPDDLLAPPARLLALDMAAARPERPRVGAATFTPEREGPLHGIAAWFSAELAPDLWLDTSPAAPATVWRQLYLPLSPHPPASPETPVSLEIAFEAQAPGHGPALRWQARIGDHTIERDTRLSFPHTLPGFGDVQS